MFQVFLAVAIGFIVGHLKLLPQNSKLIQRSMTFGLIFLLVVMGAQLGANKQLLADFGRMGMQAVLLAAGAVAGSVLMVRLGESYIHKGVIQKDSSSPLVKKHAEVGESK